jgi:hypothetical protein
MPPELDDYIVLRKVHIYRGNPLGNPRPRGLRRGGRSDRQWWHEGETLIRHKRRPRGPVMGWAKPHAEGGPEAQVPILQHKSGIILTPLTVSTLATTDVETEAKLKEE